MLKNKNAVIYARFSPRKNANECESCDAQIEYAINYCKFNEMTVLSTHRDDGLSGASAENRPGLQAALVEAKKYKAVLIVYSLSRLARNTRETIEIGDELNRAGADICSVTEKIDTTSAMGKAFFQIIAVLAELERQQISERTAAAMMRHQANGRRMSHLLPFGWRDDPDNPARMLPDETELRTIAMIKKLREEGYTYRGICDWLDQNGYVPRPIEKKIDGEKVTVKGNWQFSTIRYILKRAEREAG